MEMVQHVFAKDMVHHMYTICIEQYVVHTEDVVLNMCTKAIVSLKSMVTDDWFAVHLVGAQIKDEFVCACIQVLPSNSFIGVLLCVNISLFIFSVLHARSV